MAAKQGQARRASEAGTSERPGRTEARQQRIRAAAEGDTRIPLPPRVRGPRPIRQRSVTPYGAARGVVRGTRSVAERVTGADGGGRYSHVLMAELLLFFVLVGLRTVNEYVPFDQGGKTEGTGPGAVVPKSGQAGVVAVLVGGLGTWFVLSLVAKAGEQWARASAWFGALVLIGLAYKSQDELVAAAAWLDVAHHKAAAPTAVGTTAPIVVTGGSSTSSGSSSSNPSVPPPTLSNPGHVIKPDSAGHCPAGYTAARNDKGELLCWPNAVGFVS